MTTTARRWNALLLTGPAFCAAAACGSSVTAWACLARGAAGLDVAPIAFALSYLCVLTGGLCLRALRLPRERFGDVPTTFLVGFFSINVALLVLTVAAPLPLPVDGLAVVLVVAAWALAAGPEPPRAGAGFSYALPGLACVALSLLAATFWSIDSIVPSSEAHSVVVFAPWCDSFFHGCEVRMLRDARGVATFQNLGMSGEPAPVYHYGSYVVPALLAAVTDTPCYLAYTSFQVPLSVALTGLAAYTLARVIWWGPGAGLAATAAVLLIPDASYYGLKNPWLSAFWLEQTGASLGFGVALTALAWVAVFEGCRSGHPRVLAAGFLAALLTVVFKAHLFVANALLIWISPAFLARRVRPRWRVAWLAIAVVSFVAVVTLAQGRAGVPDLRLDGSGMRSYLPRVIFNLNDSALRERHDVNPTTPWPRALGLGLYHLTLGTFGAFAPACVVLAALTALGRGRGPGGSVGAAFPLALLANYLIMSLGLTSDSQHPKHPHELLHRPLVWAYFGVAAWTGGCFYEIALGPLARRFRSSWVVLAVALAALLAFPITLGLGVQVGPEWGRHFTSLPLPVGLVRSARFLREQSGRGEVVQDSEDDPLLALSALSERPPFAVDTWETGDRPALTRRLEEVRSFRLLADPDKILAFAKARGISWYVLHPETHVNWPLPLLGRPAFESGGFRVYHFPGPPRARQGRPVSLSGRGRPR